MYDELRSNVPNLVPDDQRKKFPVEMTPEQALLVVAYLLTSVMILADGFAAD